MLLFLKSVLVCVHMYVYASVCACKQRCRQRPENRTGASGAGATGSVSHLVGVLGTQLRSSARTVGTLQGGANSPAPFSLFSLTYQNH